MVKTSNRPRAEGDTASANGVVTAETGCEEKMFCLPPTYEVATPQAFRYFRSNLSSTPSSTTSLLRHRYLGELS